MNLIERAEAIARKAHEGQFRRDGITPYITHPERVVARLRRQGIDDENILAAAWLHDVVEDTDVEIEELKYKRIPDNVIVALELLTKGSWIDYPDYVAHVCRNTIAHTVKIADILDNLSDSPTEKQVVKYAKALLYLHNETP